MIARHEPMLPGPHPPDAAPPPAWRVEPPDEVERAKLALLEAGSGYGPVRRRRNWPGRHPLLLGAGLFVAGLLVGRSPVLRGMVAATALLAARAVTQRIAGRIVGRLRF